MGGYVTFSKGFRHYRIFHDLGHADPILWEIVHVGWPIAGSYMFENGLFLITTMLMGFFGAAALAAHTVVIGLCSFTFMIPYAISQAGTTRVGHAVGAGNATAARWAGYVALHMGVMWMTFTAALFLILPRHLIALYIDIGDPQNQATLAVALAILPIAALFQVFDGTQSVAGGVLRGYKDTRIPMLLCFLGYWLIGVTAACILGFGLKFGAVGLWFGLAIGLAVTAIALTWRYHRLAQRVHDMKKRADLLLVERGLVETRSRALAVILAGKVFSGEQRIKKAGDLLAEDQPLELRGQDHPWVSRGGLKLVQG